jgi:hypothetical protein
MTDFSAHALLALVLAFRAWTIVVSRTALARHTIFAKPAFEAQVLDATLGVQTAVVPRSPNALADGEDDASDVDGSAKSASAPRTIARAATTRGRSARYACDTRRRGEEGEADTGKTTLLGLRCGTRSTCGAVDASVTHLGAASVSGVTLTLVSDVTGVSH